MIVAGCWHKHVLKNWSSTLVKRINNVGRQWLCSRQLTLLPSSSNTHWRRIFSSAKVPQSAIAKWAKRFFRMNRKISIFIYSEWEQHPVNCECGIECGVVCVLGCVVVDDRQMGVTWLRWMCRADDYGFAQHRHSFCLVGCQAQHLINCGVFACSWQLTESTVTQQFTGIKSYHQGEGSPLLVCSIVNKFNWQVCWKKRAKRSKTHFVSKVDNSSKIK